MPVERLQAPSRGIDNDSSPDYVETTEAPHLENLLPGIPGKTLMRGSFRLRWNIAASEYGRPDAIWTFDDKAYVGAGTDTKVVTLSGTTVTSVTPAAVPSSSAHARVGDLVYGASGTSGSGFYPKLAKWDPSTDTFVEQSTAPAPTGFVDVKQHLQRLWVLGGTKPGTTTPLKPHSLFWSDPGGPVTDALSSWQDDVSGLTNEIVYAATDTPVGLARCGTTMAILTNRSIYLLTGTSNASFAIRLLSSGFGCSDARTIVEADDGFYYLSDRGYVFCDGSTTRIVSKPIHGEIRAQFLAVNAWSATMFNDGYIALCNSSTTGRLWLYHIESDTWTTIRSDLWANASSRHCYVSRGSSIPIIWDGKDLWGATFVTRFESLQPGSVRGFDVENGSSSVLFAAVPVSWWSRLARLAAPGNAATVGRLLLDYRFEVDPSSDVQTDSGWYVSVVDGQDNVLLADVQVPCGAAGSRSRFQVAINGEASEAQLRAEWRYTGTPPGLTYAELYDAWLEFTPAMVRSTR